MLMFVSSCEVKAGIFTIAVTYPDELLAQVVKIVGRDAIALHPVADEFPDGDVPGTGVGE